MQDEPTAHPVAYSRTEAQRKQDDLVAEFNKLSIENAALRARVAELEEKMKPFADAYEAEKESSVSGVVAVRNMAAHLVYSDFRELRDVFGKKAQS